VVQDLDTKQLHSINIEDHGEIQPGMNNDYLSKELTFYYSSPFVYE
jgi:hypothetical protein